MIDDVIGKELEGHLHVLVSIEWGSEIHVLDVRATEFGCWGTDDTVSHNFAETMSAEHVVSLYG